MCLAQPAALASGRVTLATTLLLAAHMAVAEHSPAELEVEVARLTRELAQARAALAQARRDTARAEKQVAAQRASDIVIGPFTVGGAVRINYVHGDYEKVGSGPQRGGDGGNMELDTFRINAELNHGQLTGQLEYRWYDGYNFLHTGWLGYQFNDGGELQAGLTRVPFGPGPYGVSQSWFFDQHFYVGLADDMDLGLKYLARRGNWDLALGFFW